MFGMSTAAGHPDEIPLDAWADGESNRAGRALSDLCDWWEHRNDDRVLFLFFDDMKLEHVPTNRGIHGLGRHGRGHTC